MIKKLLIIICIAGLFASCSKPIQKPVIIATNPVLASILKEITGDAADVKNILPAGGSPHTFSPGPGIVKDIESASALFYVNQQLDGWVASAPSKEKISLFDLVGRDMVLYFDTTDYKVNDPHFWTDPIAVASTLPALANKLGEIDPKNKSLYKSNIEAFMIKLVMLDRELKNLLLPIKGTNVVLFHPSFRYFLKKYGMNYIGSVEESPGKEPTPQSIANLLRKIKSNKVKALFSETELPEKSATAIAESANLPVFKLDPLGGVSGRKTYNEIILYNANIFLKALR